MASEGEKVFSMKHDFKGNMIPHSLMLIPSHSVNHNKSLLFSYIILLLVYDNKFEHSTDASH